MTLGTRLTGVLLGICLTALAASGCRDESGSTDASVSPGPAAQPTTIPQPADAEVAAAGLDLPVAATADRVDLVLPPFSNSTKITNPLFPISKLSSAILSGTVDDKDFKTETTLLPETRIIEWNGVRIESLVSQYVAYLDGRIEEVALDHYAQADDGSVWYLGEDVFNYRDGLIADTEGTWFAGREGPPALIMPGDPRVGDVYRPENIPGLVFEEVTIKAVDQTVDGPHGSVQGTIVASELHQDGSREDKAFAPGYGEFLTASGGDVEAMSLAVPADELSGPVPAELEALSAEANDVFDLAESGRWKASSASVRTMGSAWKAFRTGDVPPRLETRMSRALAELRRAVAAHDAVEARRAALGVAQASLDLQLRHRPPAAIDRDRFELWARQLEVDAAAGNTGRVMGDLATLEWIRDRFESTLDKVDAVRIDVHLGELRTRLNDDELEGAGAEAARLGETLAEIAGSS